MERCRGRLKFYYKQVLLYSVFSRSSRKSTLSPALRIHMDCNLHSVYLCQCFSYGIHSCWRPSTEQGMVSGRSTSFTSSQGVSNRSPEGRNRPAAIMCYATSTRELPSPLLFPFQYNRRPCLHFPVFTVLLLSVNPEFNSVSLSWQYLKHYRRSQNFPRE
jgi:hypothetical protein